MKKILLAIIVVTGLLGGQAPAQVLVNGGFEADAGTIGTGKVANGFGAITGWQNINATANNSGVQYGTPGTGINQSQSGNYFAFQDSDDGNGGNQGAFQITNTVLQAGDQITLTWYAANTFGNPIQNVNLLSASTPGASFASASILTPSNNPVLTLGPAYAEYTLEYTATAADAGKYLGVSFSTTGASNSFVQYDSFVVEDVSTVPEPSVYALLLAGLGGVLMIGKSSRARLGFGKPKWFWVLAIMVGCLAQSGFARAQILTNGDFEGSVKPVGTDKVTTGFAKIPGWKDMGDPASNSGVQYGSSGDALNCSQAGNYFAFQDSDDGNGANRGAYQITNTVLHAGDQITLTWYAVNTTGTPTQNVNLLAAPARDAAFDAATVLKPGNNPVLTLNDTYTKYTITYTATAADEGKYLGVSFSTTGSNNSFVQYDSFVLTVGAAK